MIKKIVHFIPSILIMFLIFFLSSRSSTGIGGSRTQQFLIHKTLHIIVYALLSASFYYAFSTSTLVATKYIFILSVILTFLYGITDEIHQTFVPGRGGKFSDTLFDLIGAFLGTYLYQILFAHQINYQSNQNR